MHKELLEEFRLIEGFESYSELTPEASVRRYYRLQYKDTGTKVLVIDPGLVDDSNSFLQTQNLLKTNGILVPEIHRVDFERHVLVQTDLGNQDLSGIEEIGEYKELLKKSIGLILDIQKIHPIPLVGSRSFDEAKLFFEFNHTLRGIQSFSQKTGLNFQPETNVKVFFENNVGLLSKYTNKVICHRDFHSRNIMLLPGDELALIDFQDMMMGTPQYDLVSILYDAYKPIPFAMKEELVDYFLTKSNEKYIKFREYYWNQAIQRSFKALGTYLVMYSEKGMEKYFSSIQPCLENLIEIIQVAKFPDSLYLYVDDFLSKLKSMKPKSQN